MYILFKDISPARKPLRRGERLGCIRSVETIGDWFRCRICGLWGHPSDLCQKVYEVATYLVNDDTLGDPVQPGLVKTPGRDPCEICLRAGEPVASIHHTTNLHGVIAWYLHPDSPSLPEMIKDAMKPADVIACFRYLRPWPSSLKKKPLPLYCFMPHAYEAPKHIAPLLIPPLTYGFQKAGESIVEAVKRQRLVERGITEGRQMISSSTKALFDDAIQAPPGSPCYIAGAYYHPDLTDRFVLCDEVYICSTSFVKQVQHLFIPQHADIFHRLQQVARHYHDYYRWVFVKNASLKYTISYINGILWFRILRYYAKSWHPALQGLGANTAKRLVNDLVALERAAKQPLFELDACAITGLTVTAEQKVAVQKCTAHPNTQ